MLWLSKELKVRSRLLVLLSKIWWLCNRSLKTWWARKWCPNNLSNNRGLRCNSHYLLRVHRSKLILMIYGMLELSSRMVKLIQPFDSNSLWWWEAHSNSSSLGWILEWWWVTDRFTKLLFKRFKSKRCNQRQKNWKRRNHLQWWTPVAIWWKFSKIQLIPSTEIVSSWNSCNSWIREPSLLMSKLIK